MTGSSPRPRLLLDANVLIDYHAVGWTLFERLVAAVDLLAVHSLVDEELASVPGNTREYQRRGLSILDPTLDEIMEAMDEGPSQFHDLLCFLIARRLKLTCVTNDRKLRRRCTASGVKVLWGLEPLYLLVSAKACSAKEALQMAQDMRASNPYHLHEEILERFKTRLGIR